MDPKLDLAFVKAIKAYFEDVDVTEYNKASGKERKFSKKYFDSMEEEHLGKIYPKTKKQKRKHKDADKPV